MRTLKTTFAALLLSLPLTACGSATMVQQDARSGKFVLNGSYGFAIGDARTQLIEHCNGRYESRDRDGTLEYTCLDKGQSGTAPIASRTAGSESSGKTISQ